ncbi:2-C-methyl-D-erythritol 4-phosphate cytidylyltransferase [Arthrobacter halodurans]|uniref:2-C-methyl-D-erythritol 4-phosphate cytidylyltransferase n=1 Tax=Arthrobacter halodurans TaxID=516699 RepID=A0ABV4UMN8_9MICC
MPTHQQPRPDPQSRAAGPAAGGPAAAGGTAVVVVAAGSGTRLGLGIPKALVPLGGRPLLAHALDGVIASGVATRIVVVLPPGDTELVGVCAGYAPAHPIHTVTGGASRTASVRAGLDAAGPGIDHVLVHDAARCLTPGWVFSGVVEALRAGADAVVPAVPVVDTIKSVVASASPRIGPEIVAGTHERSTLRAVQTPQGFRLGRLLAAHAEASTWEADRAVSVTDDAALMEAVGETVYVVPGAPESLKITTRIDLLLAETLVSNGYEEQS